MDEPFQSSVDDVINVYQSSGTAASPIRIHDNYIQGAFPNNPLTDGYSGGGIITDGGVADTQASASAYVAMEDNQMSAPPITACRSPTGTTSRSATTGSSPAACSPDGRDIAAQNVGIYISDIYRDAQGKGNVEHGTMYNDHALGNVTGWVNKAPRLAGQGYRNDYYFSIPDSGSDYARNKPWPHPVTPADEAAELALWRAVAAPMWPSALVNRRSEGTP